MIIMGDYSYFKNNIREVMNDTDAKVIVGKFCSISKVNIMLGGNHRPEWVTTFPFGFLSTDVFPYEKDDNYVKTNGNVVIGNDVWIGAGTTIMSGIRIGDGAVIAMNSHVIHNVKPYAVVGGNPAQFYYFRFSEDVIKKLLELKWWNWDIKRINENISTLCSQDFSNLFK